VVTREELDIASFVLDVVAATVPSFWSAVAVLEGKIEEESVWSKAVAEVVVRAEDEIEVLLVAADTLAVLSLVAIDVEAACVVVVVIWDEVVVAWIVVADELCCGCEGGEGGEGGV
jgi:hypothetical protein